MKLNIFFSATAFLLISLISSSCGGKDNGKDPETNPCALTTCYNGGHCVNGDCECPLWYEGSNCNQEVRTKFYGNFYGLYTLESGLDVYSAYGTINVGSSAVGVQYISFDGGFIRLQLTNETGSFNVPVQSTTNGRNITSGYGSFSGNQLFCTFIGTDSDGIYELYKFSGSK